MSYKIARTPATAAKRETKCFIIRSKRFNCFMRCKAENIFSSKELATCIINWDEIMRVEIGFFPMTHRKTKLASTAEADEKLSAPSCKKSSARFSEEAG